MCFYQRSEPIRSVLNLVTGTNNDVSKAIHILFKEELNQVFFFDTKSFDLSLVVDFYRDSNKELARKHLRLDTSSATEKDPNPCSTPNKIESSSRLKINHKKSCPILRDPPLPIILDPSLSDVTRNGGVDEGVEYHGNNCNEVDQSEITFPEAYVNHNCDPAISECEAELRQVFISSYSHFGFVMEV